MISTHSERGTKSLKKLPSPFARSEPAPTGERPCVTGTVALSRPELQGSFQSEGSSQPVGLPEKVLHPKGQPPTLGTPHIRRQGVFGEIASPADRDTD